MYHASDKCLDNCLIFVPGRIELENEDDRDEVFNNNLHKHPVTVVYQGGNMLETYIFG
jgi:hypothetical protein